jgi:hypothetical protein
MQLADSTSHNVLVLPSCRMMHVRIAAMILGGTSDEARPSVLLKSWVMAAFADPCCYKRQRQG